VSERTDQTGNRALSAPHIWSAVTIDCLDPARLASFWGALLGWSERPTLPGWRRLAGDDQEPLHLNLQPVPEPKVGKNRLHLDVTVREIESAMQTVVDLGGTWTGERHDYPGEGFVVVMADPEGNSFCLVEYSS
jgi:predicted enzyme related to lactoylglutathione lyase